MLIAVAHVDTTDVTEVVAFLRAVPRYTMVSLQGQPGNNQSMLS